MDKKMTHTGTPGAGQGQQHAVIQWNAPNPAAFPSSAQPPLEFCPFARSGDECAPASACPVLRALIQGPRKIKLDLVGRWSSRCCLAQQHHHQTCCCCCELAAMQEPHRRTALMLNSRRVQASSGFVVMIVGPEQNNGAVAAYEFHAGIVTTGRRWCFWGETGGQYRSNRAGISSPHRDRSPSTGRRHPAGLARGLLENAWWTIVSEAKSLSASRMARCCSGETAPLGRAGLGQVTDLPVSLAIQSTAAAKVLNHSPHSSLVPLHGRSRVRPAEPQQRGVTSCPVKLAHAVV